jgi:CBS domain-containing protein
VALAPSDDLLHALGVLLAEGRDSLPVRDETGAVIGCLSLHDLRRLAGQPEVMSAE